MATIINSEQDLGVTLAESLKGLYVKLGGSLTDTYETIASGDTVGDMVTLPDLINAIGEIVGGVESEPGTIDDGGGTIK